MVTKCRMSLPQWNHHCYRFFAPPLPLTIAHNLNFTVSCNRRTSHLIPHTSSLTLHSSSLSLSPLPPLPSLQCYSFASECLEAQHKWSKASVFRDRHLQLATEARSMEEIAKAHMGAGRIYVALGRNRYRGG